MENRNLERYKLDLPVKLITKGESGEANVLELHTRDISSKGTFIQTGQPLPKGSHVELEVYLSISKLIEMIGDQGQVRVKVEGEVIRTNVSGMAILFDKRYEIMPVKRPDEEENAVDAER